MAEDKSLELPEISSESIKCTAESISVATLAEDACKYMAEDVTYRLRDIVQEAHKLSLHSKRTKLTTADIDSTLKMKNYEPLYGFKSSDYIPFRNASGGGRELHFNDDKEIDLDDLLSKPLAKIPLQVSLKAHWLAIEGVQPAIPENPPPVSRNLQKLEGINPGTKATVEKLGKPRGSHALKKSKDVLMKPLAEHDLSVEQQLYYKEITEACVGSEESRRVEALASLSQDPGLHKMLPRFSTFISEGVKINCVNSNLAILIYLMRMLKALLENGSLYLEKYLHELIPATITCIVSKQLCVKPDVDNHWALRDFASKILGSICTKFNSSTNDIQTRIVKILTDALHNPRAPLASHYGCVMALGELGPRLVENFVIPIVKLEGDRVRALLEGAGVNNADKVAAQAIKRSLITSVAPVLKDLRKSSDSVDSYRQDFGYFGPFLHDATMRIRSQSTAATSLLSKNAATVAMSRSQGGVTLLQPGQHAAVSRSFSLPVGSRSATPSHNLIRMSGVGTSLVRGPVTPTTPGSASSSQKYIIMSSTPASAINSSQPSPATPTIVKVMTTQGVTTPQSQNSPSQMTAKTLPPQPSAGDQAAPLPPPQTSSS